MKAVLINQACPQITMSALGHKQTFAMQKGMSALPPKADICSAPVYVRFVPIADIGTKLVCPLFDQLVSTDEQGGRDGKFKRLSGPHVDDKFELRRSLNR